MAPAASVEKAVLSPLHCFCKKSFGHVSVGCLIFLNIKVAVKITSSKTTVCEQELGAFI